MKTLIIIIIVAIILYLLAKYMVNFTIKRQADLIKNIEKILKTPHLSFSYKLVRCMAECKDTKGVTAYALHYTFKRILSAYKKEHPPESFN